MRSSIIRVGREMPMWIDKTEIEKLAIEERSKIQIYGIKDIFSLLLQ